MTKREHYKGRNFWRANSKDKCLVYPINEEIIRKAEVSLGIKFPSSFVDLMQEQNGGELNYPCFVLSTPNLNYQVDEAQRLPSIEPIHFETDDVSILTSKELIEASKGMRNEDALPEGLVVLWTNFHHWFVFDYQGRKENPLIVYIVENYTDENSAWKYIKVADSFDDFLKKLHRKIS